MISDLRYPAWHTIVAEDWTPDSASAPTKAHRDFGNTAQPELPVYQFSQSTDQYLSALWVLPAEFYHIDGISIYIGWLPGASWTSGDYKWYVELNGANRNGYTISSATKASQAYEVTPDNATTLREDYVVNWKPITAGQGLMGCSIWLDASESSANDVGELAWVRYQYTAWRAGTDLHPMQKITP